MSGWLARACATLVEHALRGAGPQLPLTATRAVRAELGAERIELRLVDRTFRFLHPAGSAPSDGALDRLLVTETEAGRALTTGRVQRVPAAHATHVPVAVRGHALGVLTVYDLDPLPGTDAELTRLGEVLALLLFQADAVTDALETRRRAYDYSINAELQWQLLPPPGLSTPSFAVHALIEPAPRVTTDLYDWSHDEDTVWLAVLDATGRGIGATQVADLAVAALRNARRLGVPLAEQAGLTDQALYDRHHGHGSVQGLLVQIDLATGTALAVHAGSAVALRRRGTTVTELALEAQYPLGLVERPPYRAHAIDLRAGDALLLASDGALSAADVVGAPYGLGRIIDELAAGRPDLVDLPRRLAGALRRHVGGDLAEDATFLLFDWFAPSAPGA
ncbi:serine/threonine-protein phosphatase [Pseudonocardia sp. RS11V-5]|uniref:PP2C family protein-serine/threonine phosphatase n=1 Tax=Pseudonocardia terrae TaxID=2905831 RepID=UPI001E2B3A92|nr:PP2C family protein-serine/threonine phosphatase [Pseudonocardia terrae]MCE3552580.1 serine/threonine-protein phosphatase [Pseudonocardia terrae]